MAALAEDAGTSDRIVQSAAILFAEKGYRNTTIQDICNRADANVASVNYYSRSKENLYREVWRFCRDLVEKTHALSSPPNQDPMARIIAQNEAAIRAIFDDGPGGLFPKIIHREMMDPSPISEELREGFMEPLRTSVLSNVLLMLAPPKSPSSELSAVKPCAASANNVNSAANSADI